MVETCLLELGLLEYEKSLDKSMETGKWIELGKRTVRQGRLQKLLPSIGCAGYPQMNKGRGMVQCGSCKVVR